MIEVYLVNIVYVDIEMGNLRGKCNYKGQYKVCVAFYNEIIKFPRWDNNRFGLLFDELFESINPKKPEEELLRLHQCVNELDNFIGEIDDYDSTTFFQIAKGLEKVMKKL